MNTHANWWLLIPVLAVVSGCGTTSPKEPSSNAAEPQHASAPSSGGLPKRFAELGSPDLRTKAQIERKAGKPVEARRIPGYESYSFSLYEVEDWNERLIIVFHGEQLIGFGREQAEASLLGMVRSHQRTTGDRAVLYQKWSDGKTHYFMARRGQLENAPKLMGDDKRTPLTEQEVECIVSQWQFEKGMENTTPPRILGFHEWKPVAGSGFYVVGMNRLNPFEHVEVVVLMDGTIVEGEQDVPR